MRALLCLILLAAALPAQRRFVVDAGGGGHFTDLPLALASARDGDVFVVLPGVYTPAVTNKGVRILGGDRRYLRQGTFVVRSLGRAATFAISGFETDATADQVVFRIEGSVGPAVLQRP